MNTPISMQAAQQRLQQKKQAARTLDAFDRITHTANRERIEQKKETERRSRQQL